MLNYGLNKVIGDNETGFRGIEGRALPNGGVGLPAAGGGLYNNLDYSFTAGHEDGTFALPEQQPGGGGKERQATTRSEGLHPRVRVCDDEADEKTVRGAGKLALTSAVGRSESGK